MAKSAEELLIYLFDEILPKHGMNLRVKQKELSLEMLRALQENKLALCEAEVGTGKTHAYILALTVHNIYSDKKIPAVISTSTIALQKALTEEYIPQISGILLEHHVIDKPLSFVVRKGKRHYVCDSRLKIYETCVKKHISARKLEKAVLEAVQIHLKIFLEGREEIRSRNGSAEIGKRRMVLESETRDLRQKEAQYQQKLSSTYLDYKDKLLTVQEYFMLKNKYQAALAELEVARKEKELLLNKMQETYGEDLELSHAAEKYFGQMVVTKDMVDALIERIEVFAKGRIHIIFRFEDEYRSLLEKRADMEQEGAN